MIKLFLRPRSISFDEGVCHFDELSHYGHDGDLGGQWQGKSFIGGGRKQLRDALYMPALVAIKHNPDIKAKYEALCLAGKPAKVAIVAVMRKLIEMANALVKADRTWTQKKLDQDGYFSQGSQRACAG